MLRRGISNVYEAARILQINKENVRFMKLYEVFSDFITSFCIYEITDLKLILS